MQTKSRKLKEDFWFWVIFIALVLFALISDWWKTNATLGWAIILLVSAIVIFVFIRFRSVRLKAGQAVKSTAEKIIYDSTEIHRREPVPNKIRKRVLERARNRCENHDCKYTGMPEVHHIDGNNSNNDFRNLIALCRNCHNDAGNGVITASQCRNWVKRDYFQMKNNRIKVRSS
ncbi:HNH endonuclease [Dehalococcoides mccartyi]|uniref:HNH endonuclease n=1 Tax=Dehalococcoides mccartyi TaxID=61435 RepID=UPI00242AF42A|nr:HNH endonuclease [Dehalococcoides mccartyi]